MKEGLEDKKIIAKVVLKTPACVSSKAKNTIHGKKALILKNDQNIFRKEYP